MQQGASLPCFRQEALRIVAFQLMNRADAFKTGAFGGNAVPMPNDILDPRSFQRPGLNGIDADAADTAPTMGGITTISAEARLEGAKISHCHTLHVAGRLVDVTLTDVKFLEIAEGGYVEGSAKVEQMRVSGHATGNLEISGTLHVGETGQVEGSIRYGRIAIADGGSVSGSLQVNKPQ
jgi:cytoskeletal protein CcmA (bactofilin family)